MNIITKSNKAKREVSVVEPAILGASTVKDLVEGLGEDLVVAKIKAQLTIDFRSMVRNLLEAGDIENGEYTNSDEAILAMDFSDWKPELRVRKSKEERAADVLKGMSPDEIKKALAMLDAQ